MTEAGRPPVAAVILAAGTSTRMGRPKLLLAYHGVPLIRRAVETAVRGGCTEAVVVLGADQDRYQSHVQGLPASRIVVNPDFARGMGGSIRVGIEALNPDTRAAIILLADQPFIDDDVIARLIDTYVTSKAKIVACTYGGVRGAPVLFDRALFLELLLLDGDQGARHVLKEYPRHVTTIEISRDAATDIDTPDDAQRLLNGA